MLIIPEFTRRVRRPRETTNVGPEPTLTLTSATYDPGTSVTLTFDRAVDIDAFDATVLVLADGVTMDFTYVGLPGGATLTSPTTVFVSLDGRSGGAAGGVHLSVPAGSGIVDAATGTAWAGVDQLPLPFDG